MSHGNTTGHAHVAPWKKDEVSRLAIPLPTLSPPKRDECIAPPSPSASSSRAGIFNRKNTSLPRRGTHCAGRTHVSGSSVNQACRPSGRQWFAGCRHRNCPGEGYAILRDRESTSVVWHRLDSSFALCRRPRQNIEIGKSKRGQQGPAHAVRGRTLPEKRPRLPALRGAAGAACLRQAALRAFLAGGGEPVILLEGRDEPGMWL